MNIYEMSVVITAWVVTGILVHRALRNGSNWVLWALWIPLLMPLLFPSFYRVLQ